MTAITFEECLAGAWRDAWKLARQRPMFVTAATMAIFLLQFVLEELHRAPGRRSLAILLLLIVVPLLKFWVMNLIVVQAMRFVLLGDGDTATIIGRDLWRYCGITLGILLVSATGVVAASMIVAKLLPNIGIHAHARALTMTSACAFVMLAVWLNLRLSLLPCHIAVGRPLNLPAAWRDSRHNTLRIASFHFVLWLTLCAFAVPVALVGGVVAITLGEGRHGPVFGLLQMLAYGPMLVVLGAGSAWMYKRFANTLPGVASAA
jgi:hypothetical protein